MAPESKDYRVKPRLASLLSTYSPSNQISLKAPRQDFKGDLKVGSKVATLPARSNIFPRSQTSAIEIRRKVSSSSLKRSPSVEQKAQKIQPSRPTSVVSTSAVNKARTASSVRPKASTEAVNPIIRPRPISSPSGKPINQLKSDAVVPAQVQSSPTPVLVPPPKVERKPSAERSISARPQPVIKATGVQKKTELPPKGRTFVSKSGRNPSLNLPPKHLPQRARTKESTQPLKKLELDILTAQDLDKPMTAEELWEKIEKFSEWLANTVNNRKDTDFSNSLGQTRKKDRWAAEKKQDSSSDSVTDQVSRRRSRPKRNPIPNEQSFKIRKSICSKVPGASATIGREDLLDLYPKLESHPCLSNPGFFSGVKVPVDFVDQMEPRGLQTISKDSVRSRSRSISPTLKLPGVRGCLDEECFKDALRRSLEVPHWAEGYFQKGDTEKPGKVTTADSSASELGSSNESGAKPGVLSKILSMYQNSDNSMVTDVDSDAVSVESAAYNVTPEAELDK